MSWEYDNYLAHHGVKGQKWGHRQWQNEDGTYTEAGKRHYGWGYGRQTAGQQGGVVTATRQPRKNAKTDGYHQSQLWPGTRTTTSSPQRRQPTQEEVEARKARTRKILTIAGGVAVAAALSYAAYKGGKSFKNWRNEGYAARSRISRQLAIMDVNRFESMRSGGWSKAAERSYRRNVRMKNRAALRTYFTGSKYW